MLETQVREIRTKLVLYQSQASSSVMHLYSNDFPFVRAFYNTCSEERPTHEECLRGLYFLDDRKAHPLTMKAFADSYYDDCPELELDFPRYKRYIDRIPDAIELDDMQNEDDGLSL